MKEEASIIEEETLNEMLEKYSETEILKIKTSELSVPIETAAEVSQLYAVEKQIFINLLKNKRVSEDGITSYDPDALSWAKELRQTAKLVHELTGKVQEKQMLKKMDIAGDLYKMVLEKKSPQEQREAIKKLREASS